MRKYEFNCRRVLCVCRFSTLTSHHHNLPVIAHRVPKRCRKRALYYVIFYSALTHIHIRGGAHHTQLMLMIQIGVTHLRRTRISSIPAASIQQTLNTKHTSGAGKLGTYAVRLLYAKSVCMLSLVECGALSNDCHFINESKDMTYTRELRSGLMLIVGRL